MAGWITGVIMGRDSTRTPIMIQAGFVCTYLLRRRNIHRRIDRYHWRVSISSKKNRSSISPQELVTVIFLEFQAVVKQFLVLLRLTFIDVDLLSLRESKISCRDRLQPLPCEIKFSLTLCPTNLTIIAGSIECFALGIRWLIEISFLSIGTLIFSLS